MTGCLCGLRNILQGKADIDMTTLKYHTPLLLAVATGQAPLIELLVVKGNKLCLIYLYTLFSKTVSTNTLNQHQTWC